MNAEYPFIAIAPRSTLARGVMAIVIGNGHGVVAPDKGPIYGLNRGGARGIMVIVVGNGHGDTSSNPGRG